MCLRSCVALRSLLGHTTQKHNPLQPELISSDVTMQGLQIARRSHTDELVLDVGCSCWGWTAHCLPKTFMLALVYLACGKCHI